MGPSHTVRVGQKMGESTSCGRLSRFPGLASRLEPPESRHPRAPKVGQRFTRYQSRDWFTMSIADESGMRGGGVDRVFEARKYKVEKTQFMSHQNDRFSINARLANGEQLTFEPGILDLATTPCLMSRAGCSSIRNSPGML